MQEQAILGGLMGEVRMEDALKEGEQEMFLDHQEYCNKALQLSLHSMVGLTSKKSLKLWGHIGDSKVVVLVDCGAYDRYLARKIDIIDGKNIRILPRLFEGPNSPTLPYSQINSCLPFPPLPLLIEG